ncbi:MAG: alpha/beta hydrolase [Chitinophagaceae bacterium]
MSLKKIILSVGILGLPFNLYAQKIIPLYPGTIPNSIHYNMHEITLLDGRGKMFGYSNISQPTLTVFLPLKERSNGSAVIICPGGGYVMETYQWEGIHIAKTFIQHGIAAFVLKYRLPSDSIMKDKSIGPLQDAQQAIKLVRQHAAEWGIDTNKVGIMGFSAGGHVASSAGTHFDSAFIPNKKHINLRPDFMILVYPVISMTNQLAHMGSRENLLGPHPSPEKIKFFSGELQVTDETPPTWLTQAGDDQVVDVDNSISFYEALRHHHVPAEMHLYPKGGHGFVLKLPTEEWMQPLFEWMKKNYWMK